MLSDEEILIKKLRYCAQEYEQNGYLSVGKFKDIKEASNLIEKQSKEIEELKEKNKYIEDRAKIGKNIQTFINKDYVEQEYISKDKIKAKIEELEKEQEDNRKDLYNAVNNLYFSKMDIISRRIFVNMSIKDILQSLLQKEE